MGVRYTTCRDAILAAFESLERRSDRTDFQLQQIVRETQRLTDRYSEETIRTYVVSVMCADAPVHHANHTDDLRRVDRGIYRRIATTDEPRTFQEHPIHSPPESNQWSDLLVGLAQKRPVFHSEADFQHAFAWELREQGMADRIRLEYRPSLDPRISIDLWAEQDGNPIAVELKYPTKRLVGDIRGERFDLKNHGAQDITRYDICKDITRVEALCDAGEVALGVSITLTNDPAYWTLGRRDTIDEQFRLHDGRELRGQLRWAQRAGKGTIKGRELPLDIRGTHRLAWRHYSSPESGTEFQSLIVEAKR